MKMLNDMELNMVVGGNLFISGDSFDNFDIEDEIAYAPDQTAGDRFGFVFI